MHDFNILSLMTVSCYLLQGSWNRKLVKKSKDSKQKYKTSEPTASEPTSPEFKSST